MSDLAHELYSILSILFKNALKFESGQQAKPSSCPTANHSQARVPSKSTPQTDITLKLTKPPFFAFVNSKRTLKVYSWLADCFCTIFPRWIEQTFAGYILSKLSAYDSEKNYRGGLLSFQFCDRRRLAHYLFFLLLELFFGLQDKNIGYIMLV